MNWKNLLEQWLPPYFQVVTKGRILNENGETSPQMDVIILSPEYPRQLVECKRYLSKGVVAVCECIHEEKLVAPYSSENRPKTGEILDALVLYEKFDNRTQRKVWRLSLDISSEASDVDSESAMKLALIKSGYITK